MEHITTARGEATDQGQGVHCPKAFDQGWRSERKHGVLRACWIKSARFESTNTGYLWTMKLYRQTISASLKRLIRKPTEQIVHGSVQSSIGDECPVRVYTQPSLCQMTLAAVAESATTQSMTRSGIQEMETEDQFNIECHKLLAGKFNRHGTIVDMDTCGAIVLTIDPEVRDGLTQQVVDRKKKCCGTKSGHLGHLFESQMVSERQIKELANIEKLEVAEVVLQEAIAQTTEIIYAGWLYDVARRTPEDLTADRSSEDAIITASRIMWSMAATKVIKMEQHHSTSDGWRSVTTWNEEERDKCWEEVTSIMTGELVIDVPTTYVSENHGCVDVHRGTNFPSGGSDAESNETECVRMAHSDTKIMPRIKPTWYGGETRGKTQLVQRSEMEPTGIRMGVKQQTC